MASCRSELSLNPFQSKHPRGWLNAENFNKLDLKDSPMSSHWTYTHILSAVSIKRGEQGEEHSKQQQSHRIQVMVERF